jgi:chromosome segregation ATPase
VRVAHEWLQAEHKRLQEYTRGIFARIHQEQQAALAKYVQSEQTLALRTQEANRHAHFLNAQTAALRQREQELAVRAEELAKTSAQPLPAEQSIPAAPQPTEEQRIALDALRAEVDRLRESDAAARAQLETVAGELGEYRRSWEQKQAEINSRHAQIEQRYRFLEKAEAAVQRRLTELEEYERSLMDELDDQEQKLAQDRRELQLHRANARGDRGGVQLRGAALNAGYRTHR